MYAPHRGRGLASNVTRSISIVNILRPNHRPNTDYGEKGKNDKRLLLPGKTETDIITGDIGMAEVAKRNPCEDRVSEPRSATANTV